DRPCPHKAEVRADPRADRTLLSPQMEAQRQDPRRRATSRCSGLTPKEASMDFRSYQKEALRTDRVPARDGADDAASLIVPMLGLAGETGKLLSEYKKHLRDGEAHRMFKERVSEELGDLLWYIANVASKFDLSLSDIAVANLAKVKQCWASART